MVFVGSSGFSKGKLKFKLWLLVPVVVAVNVLNAFTRANALNIAGSRFTMYDKNDEYLNTPSKSDKLAELKFAKFVRIKELILETPKFVSAELNFAKISK